MMMMSQKKRTGRDHARERVTEEADEAHAHTRAQTHTDTHNIQNKSEQHT